MSRNDAIPPSPTKGEYESETLAKAEAANIAVIGLSGSDRRALCRPAHDTPPPYRLSNLTRAAASRQLSRDAAKGLWLLATLDAWTPARAAVVEGVGRASRAM